MKSLEEIRELLSKITPGEWRHRQGIPSDPAGFVEAPDPDKPYAIEILGDERYPTKEADARFIAAAPGIIRDLLGVVDEIEYEFQASIKAGRETFDATPAAVCTVPEVCQIRRRTP